MATTEYRDFTIKTEDECDAKNKKRNPVQIVDRNGYHYRYCVSVDSAKKHVDAWWVWEEQTKS